MVVWKPKFSHRAPRSISNCRQGFVDGDVFLRILGFNVTTVTELLFQEKRGESLAFGIVWQGQEHGVTAISSWIFHYLQLNSVCKFCPNLIHSAKFSVLIRSLHGFSWIIPHHSPQQHHPRSALAVRGPELFWLDASNIPAINPSAGWLAPGGIHELMEPKFSSAL